MKSLCCYFLTMSLACLVTNVLCAAEPLGERIDKFIEGDRYRSAHWGILVVDAQTGETLYDHQSHKFFAPASTTKLYTVAAAFDASSRFLAVATYDHYDDARPGGSVDFWRLARDPLEPARIELVKTEHAVPVARGVHSMVLVR